jgi:hypothetical protein
MVSSNKLGVRSRRGGHAKTTKNVPRGPIKITREPLLKQWFLTRLMIAKLQGISELLKQMAPILH